ncbi:MAG TPA: alpha/beta fold hydrolase [Streptosporangiaceae bacterium]|jgi:triacylglycerol esterase/lipase EstA (alpha/beta hydrolase family)
MAPTLNIRPRLRLTGLSALLAATATVLATGAVPARAANLPLGNETIAFLNSANPLFFNASPLGANTGCRPSAAHPYPVVLVEGTFASMYNSFEAISPDLVNNGYCVYAFNYGQTIPGSGFYAMGDIAASAHQLASEVNHVLAVTGASKVDLVGWSQGGMMPRYYISKLGGAARVATLVGFAPSNSGTTLDGLQTLIGDIGLEGVSTALLSVTCPACAEQLQGSSFLTSLNQSPVAAGVTYVVIETRDDEVVTPYTNAFLPAGGSVQDITLQQQCAQDASDHISIPYDSNALQDMINALGPDNPGFQPACAAVGPLTGNV